MALLCGIDLGSLRTLSWVAWLEDGRFLLDVYVPSREHPLPAVGLPPVVDPAERVLREGYIVAPARSLEEKI